MKWIKAFALLLLLAGLAAWVATGANRGWTKTSVPVKVLDEVTGIEAITYQQRFVPGIDFLGAAAGTSAFLFGISIFFRRKAAEQS